MSTLNNTQIPSSFNSDHPKHAKYFAVGGPLPVPFTLITYSPVALPPLYRESPSTKNMKYFGVGGPPRDAGLSFGYPPVGEPRRGKIRIGSAGGRIRASRKEIRGASKKAPSLRPRRGDLARMTRRAEINKSGVAGIILGALAGIILDGGRQIINNAGRQSGRQTTISTIERRKHGRQRRFKNNN